MTIVALVVFGLVFGSFVNALVWRLHEQESLQEQILAARRSKSTQKQLRKLEADARARSMLHGRSMCSHCHHELVAKDLVPFFSWLYLKGRCRYCKVKIQDSPLVEVVTAVFFVTSYIWWPFPLHGVGLFQFIIWLLMGVGFMTLGTYDLRWKLLPNKIVFLLTGLAIVYVGVVASVNNDGWFALDAVLGAATLSGIFWVIYMISDGKWIGGGDVKLAVVLGLLAGAPIQSLLLLFISSVIGTVFSIPLLVKGRNSLKLQVPYGPFLLLATLFVVLFGKSIVHWYTHLLLPY